MHDNLDMYWDDIWREEHEPEPDFSWDWGEPKVETEEEKNNRKERIKNNLFDLITEKSWAVGQSSPISKYGWVHGEFVIKFHMSAFSDILKRLSGVLNDDWWEMHNLNVQTTIKIYKEHTYMYLANFAKEYDINLEDIFPKEKYDYNR